MRLTDWAVRRVMSKSKGCWMGVLLGDGPRPQDAGVVTSPIASVVGRLVTTRNGSEYLLVGAHRHGQHQFCGPEDGPMDAIGSFAPFCLADGVTPWPPGSTVPVLDPDEYRER